MKTTILAESGELGVHHPCEGCTLRMKTAILVESGDLGVLHPCECCTPRMKITIFAESGDDRLRDPCKGSPCPGQKNNCFPLFCHREEALQVRHSQLEL